MQWTSAPNIAGAPLPQRARGYWKARIRALHEELEAFLERERAQLSPWFVVGFGTGIAAWHEIAAMFPWQTVPLLGLFALLAWSNSMRVQLVAVAIAFILVNSAMINRTIEVQRPANAAADEAAR